MNEGCSNGDSGGSDPLMLANRSAVTEPFTDFSVTALLRLSVSRTYSSADVSVRGTGAPGIFGRGWHHDWESEVICQGFGGACQVSMGLGIWLDFRRQTGTVLGVAPYAGETLELYGRSEVEALGAGGQDLMIRRNTGEFVLYLSDGREFHFVPTANGSSCTNPYGAYCFDSSKNGKAHLTTEVDSSGRAIQLAYGTPGGLLTLTDALGNMLALKSSATCSGKVGTISYNGADYVQYEYYPGCDTLKKVSPADGGPALRQYEYQSTPGPGYLVTVRNGGGAPNALGDPIVVFGYAANGDATSLIDRESTIAVSYPDATHDVASHAYAAASSSVSHTRSGGGKAGVVMNDAYSQYLKWLGRFLRCHEDAKHHVRYFDRDSHHRVTRVAEYAPGVYSCQSSSPPAASVVPLREEWFEYGVQKTVAQGVQLNLNTPTRITRRSIHAAKPDAAADPYTSETSDYDPTSKPTDPVGYSCGASGLPAGTVVCRKVVRGYSVDAMNRAVAEEHTTYNSYDSQGRLVKSIGPIYTVGTAPLVNVDPVEERTYYSDFDFDMNKRGRLHTITRQVNSGLSLTVTYDTYGVFGPQTILDYNNGTTTLVWDNQGRVEGVLTPDGRQVSVRYYDGQWPRLLLLGSGAVRRFSYDDKGRVKTVEALSGDPDVPGAAPTVGWTEAREYDPAGNVKLITRTDYYGNVVYRRERTHDAEHRPSTEFHPTLPGVTASWAFDGSGFLSSFTDEEGRVTGFTPDDLNRPVVVKKSGVKPDGTPISLDVASYVYEPGGSDMQSVSDGAGRTTSYVHDDFGNVLSVTPDAATTSGGYSQAYDARGNVVQRSGGDSLLTYTYDGLDRLTSLKAKQLTANTTFTYSYTYDEPGQLGRLSRITEPDRTSTFGYDAVGRLTSEVVQEAGVLNMLTTAYVYDGDGGLEEVHSPAGLNVKYERHFATKELYRVRNISTSPTLGTKYANFVEHLPSGPVRIIHFPNGNVLMRTFSPRYELIQDGEGPILGGGTVASFQNVYPTPAGNVGSIVRYARGENTPYVVTGSTTFTYDFMDRLTEMNPGHGTDLTSYTYRFAGDKVTEAWTVGTTPTKAFTFAYDLNSNLSAVTTWSPTTGLATGKTCLVHDALNRLTAVGPALALESPGNVACKTEADLATVSVRFKYDARNRRVARQDGAGAWKQWALLPDGSPLTEFWKPATSSGDWEKIREYVWLEGRPLAQVEYPGPTAAEGYVYSVHTDHIGMPRALTNSTGAVVWSAAPTRPYGDVAETTTTDPANGRTVVTNLRLPGQYDERLLSSVGIQGPYYNWNRWYLPTMGRYMELDPISLAGILDVKGVAAPHAPDWYFYGRDNPMRFSDRAGSTTYMCMAPLHALGGAGLSRWRQKSAEQILGRGDSNPLFHQYVCTDRSGSLKTPMCGGMDYDPNWSKVAGRGKPSQGDEYSPERCRPVSQLSCMDSCIAKTILGPRPDYYNLFASMGLAGGANCQTWADGAVDACWRDCMAAD